MFYAFANGRFIVTANKDGSISLNALCVCELIPRPEDAPLIEQLVKDANCGVAAGTMLVSMRGALRAARQVLVDRGGSTGADVIALIDAALRIDRDNLRTLNK